MSLYSSLQLQQAMVDYLLNAAWQLPLVAGAAWCMLRLTRLSARTEHRAWLLVLGLCLLLPLRGIARPATPALPAPTLTHTQAELPGLAVSKAQEQVLPLGPALLRVHTLRLSPASVGAVAAGYLTIMAVALLRLLVSGLCVRSLIAASTEYAAEPAEALVWGELARQTRVALPPLRWVTGIRSPVVVGLLRPALLLPFDFWRYSPAERRAAISHELAHVARRDCLVHAITRIVALPLVWHPVAHAVQRQIARTREMACDEMAAATMPSEIVYARCLLGLAERMMAAGRGRYPGSALGLLPHGFLRSNKLEERVMHLTEVKPAMSPRQIWSRRAAGAIGLALVLAAATTFHLSPVLAQAAPQATIYHPNLKVVGYMLQEADKAAPNAPRAPLAMAHGKNAHVVLGKGEYKHRWIAADGEPFEISNNQKSEPTQAEKDAAEADLERALAKVRMQVGTINTSDLHASMDQLQGQLSALQSGKLQAQMARQQAELQQQLAYLNGPEFKKQIDEVTSANIALQMAEAQKHIAEATARLNSPEFKKQLDAASHIDSADLKRRIDDAQKKVDEAMRELNEIPQQH